MTTRLRLVIAALLSLAFHALVISGEWVPLPQAPGEPRLLQARLAPPPEPKPAVPRPKVRAARRAAPAPVPEVAAVAAASPLALPDLLPDEVPTEEVAEQPAAPEPPQQLALAAEPSVAAAAHSLPRRGRIYFTLFYGTDRFYVGTAVQSWEAGTDTYLLASDAETGGIVELFWSATSALREPGHGHAAGIAARIVPGEPHPPRQERGGAGAFRLERGQPDLWLRARAAERPLPAGTQDS